MENVEFSDPNAKNEMGYLEQYQKKGYDVNFRILEGKLIGKSKEDKFNPNDVHIVAEHRYEGMSNPSDMSILYVIKAGNEQKGTLINSYGPNADSEIHEFIESIPEENISHDDSILNI